MNKFGLLVIVATICLAYLEPIKAVRVDLTIKAGANGSDVVEATFRKILRSQIFVDDFDFIKRLAVVESNNGESSETPNDGGIWQVNSIYLQKSKSSKLNSLHSQINSTFNITWANVNGQNLSIPLYSALAARLYLSSIPESIPQTLEDQSLFWLTHYNQRDDATSNTFIEAVSKAENGTGTGSVTCTGLMDLVVVMDASGSVGAANFAKETDFLVSLFGTYSLPSVRLSYVAYDSVPVRVFGLDNTFTMDQIRAAIMNYKFTGGGTDTNKAIAEGVYTITSASPRPSNVPRVLTILTDGQSSTGVKNIELAKAANISTFAIGVGLTKTEELLEIAYGDPTRMFSLDNFDSLRDFYKRVSSETCAVPQQPILNSTIQDLLKNKERRYYSFSLPTSGLTMKMNIEAGSVAGYVSKVDDRPNSAFNDGVMVQNGITYSFGGTATLYITIEGTNSTDNVYNIIAYEGAL